MSPSKDSRCRMNKPWASRDCCRCSKQPPCISKQTGVRRTKSPGTRPASNVFTAACNLTAMSSILLAGTAYTCSFGCPHLKKSIRVDKVKQEAMLSASSISRMCSLEYCRCLPFSVMKHDRVDTVPSARQRHICTQT